MRFFSVIAFGLIVGTLLAGPASAQAGTREKVSGLHATFDQEIEKSTSNYNIATSYFDQGDRGHGCYFLQQMLNNDYTAKDAIVHEIEINDGVDYSNDELQSKLDWLNGAIDTMTQFQASTCSEAQIAEANGGGNATSGVDPEAQARFDAAAQGSAGPLKSWMESGINNLNSLPMYLMNDTRAGGGLDGSSGYCIGAQQAAQDFLTALDIIKDVSLSAQSNHVADPRFITEALPYAQQGLARAREALGSCPSYMMR